ncbi:MAG: hypothetical protein GY904_15290 [Planctomycetaceae bacterium]|nr:hypothetical protein [Planctomycetaceae bacterium]
MKLEDLKATGMAIIGVGNWPIEAIDIGLKIVLTTISIIYFTIRIKKEIKSK